MSRNPAEYARIDRILREAHSAGYRPEAVEDITEALAVINALPADEYRRVMDRIDNPDE